MPAPAGFTPPNEGEGLRVMLMGLPNCVRRVLVRRELFSCTLWAMFTEGEGLLLGPESWWILDFGGLALCCDIFYYLLTSLNYSN